jgi:hypothetical protein
MKQSSIHITEDFGWSFYDKKSYSLWIKGCLYGVHEINYFVEKIINVAQTGNHSLIQTSLLEMDGDFAFVFKTPTMIFAAVDKIRSISLFL